MTTEVALTAPDAPTEHQKRRLGSRVGLFEGILPIDRSRLNGDLVAGATLAALAIPEVMGYTKIAGTPVVTGLYTLILPVIAFALLGSSRHLVVGADSATAAILATGLLAMGAIEQTPQYVQLASFAALLCAVLLIAARVLRLGFIANFLSRAVLIGFLTGVGIQVAMGQVGGLFGISGVTGRTVEKFLETIRLIPTETSVPTLLVSVGTIGTVVIIGRINKRIPGALLAVVGSIALSVALDLQAHGVSVLGPVPGGLPTIGLPTDAMTLNNASLMLPMVFSAFIVILAQSAATSSAYAMRYGDRFDENVDLVGLGMANVGAGISGTFIVNGSPTKTEMVDSAGGRSQIAALMCAGIVAIVLLFLTKPLESMPNAVLASVVFLIGLRLIDIKGMRNIARLRRGEFAVAAVTAATVVVVGVEQGIILAMVLSIVEHLAHSYRPHDTLVALDDHAYPVGNELGTGKQVAPGIAVYRFGASLYYANSNAFTSEILALVDAAKPPLHTLILLASAIGDIDYTGADSIRQVRTELLAHGITLKVSDLEPRVRAQLDAYGLSDEIGAANLYGDVPIETLIQGADSASGSPAAGG
jgi:SulP family sulfate permease